MRDSPKIVAPPYHVQSTASELRNDFPYFAHRASVSTLWSQKWRMPCAADIYPFTDAYVADFDPIFAELARLSGDDASFLCRPDDYASRSCRSPSSSLPRLRRRWPKATPATPETCSSAARSPH